MRMWGGKDAIPVSNRHLDKHMKIHPVTPLSATWHVKVNW